MKLGIIGLGRMGRNMTLRLLLEGHQVVAYDRLPRSVHEIQGKGAEVAYSLEELVQKLPLPRTIWIMIPAGDPVDETLNGLIPHIEADDIIIDGGNSHYKDTLRRNVKLKEQGIHFLDVGTSGGIWGLTEGYSLMIGGEKKIVERVRPIFETLAPAPDKGWGHVGPNGAGHFVKMVHNGIEYGMMEAYAEGFAILKKKEEFHLDIHQVSEIWRYGSVIRSWLLDLSERALAKDSELRDVIPYVAESGEGRWTVLEAIEQEISAPVITLALLQRARSRDKESFQDRILAVLREQFGGHAVKREE